MNPTDQKFVKDIKNYEILYDKKNPDYNNNGERRKIWDLLSKEYNYDARKKWTRLREKYVKQKKVLQKSGASKTKDELIHIIKFNSHMSFIDDQIKPRKKLLDDIKKDFNPFQQETKKNEGKTFFSQFFMETIVPNSSEHLYSESSFDEHSASKRQKTNSIQENSIESSKISLRNMEPNLKPKEEDDEDNFFLCLVRTKMKRMSYVEKSKFQLEIFRKAEEIITKYY